MENLDRALYAALTVVLTINIVVTFISLMR